MNTPTVSKSADFMTLPVSIRREVDAWHRALNAVQPPIQQALQAVAAAMGCSLQSARRKYDAWRKANGDYRSLINRAKCPEERGLDPEFIEWWKQLCQENGRKCKPAFRKFVRAFHAGEIIPGVPQGTSRAQLPRGYTYANLIRFKPTKFEQAAARIGRSASANFRPLNYSTRQGLQVGQRILFDDMWHDFKVVAVGSRKPGRLLQLHAHDLFSGCQFARGMKMRLEDPATGQSIGLKEDEMVFLVAHVLAEFGFHPDGCVLMVEHGTAAIREELEKLLFDLTGGRVLVDRSGIEGASAFAGQYAGRGKGNFRFKASLESLGNLIHNETADQRMFPGQTGSNSRLNAPEELAGREKHLDALALAIVALPPQVSAKLWLPFLEVNEAKGLVNELMERINRRTEHDLEGWLECGLTATDLFIPNIGLISSAQYLALPPEKRAAVDVVATPQVRRLSPREVFDAGARQLTRLSPAQSAALLEGRMGVEVSVGDDHLIAFEDAAVSPSPMRFLAHHFAPGEKFRAVVNPWSANRLHLFNARGGWVGVVDAWQTVGRLDEQAVREQMGRAAKVEAELLAPLRARGLAMTNERLEGIRNNIAALTPKDVPMTPEQKEIAAIVKKHSPADDGGQFLRQLQGD